MWIILTKEQANSIRGNYGNYNSIEPILLKDGGYALSTKIYDYPEYEKTFPVLRICPTSDHIESVNPQEVEDEL